MIHASDAELAVAVGRLDVGERHVHDGEVERRHERAQGGDDEHRTAPAVSRPPVLAWNRP